MCLAGEADGAVISAGEFSGLRAVPTAVSAVTEVALHCAHCDRSGEGTRPQAHSSFQWQPYMLYWCGVCSVRNVLYSANCIIA